MALTKYWRGTDVGGSSVGSTPASGTFYIGGTADHDDDTLMRTVVQSEFAVRVGTTGRPPVGWWGDVELYGIARADLTGLFVTPGLDSNDAEILGTWFMYPTIFGDVTNGPYWIWWRPLEGPYSFEGQRKGFGTGVSPSNGFYHRYFDSTGTLSGAGGYTVHINERGVIRGLFGTTH